MYKFITIKNTFFNNNFKIRTLDTIEYTKYVNFLRGQEHVSIQQDLNWSFIEKKKDFEIIISTNKNKIRGSMLVYIKSIPFSTYTYLYCPNAPIIKSGEDKYKVINDLLIGATNLAKREKACFLQVDALYPENKEWKELIDKFNISTTNNSFIKYISFKKDTLCDIFNLFNQTTIENIFKAKENTRIRQGDIHDFQIFYKILKDTKNNPKPFSYYYNMLSNGNTLKNNVKLYVAEDKESEEIIGGGIFITYSNYTECIITAEKQTETFQNTNLLLHWTMLEKVWDNGGEIYKFHQNESLSILPNTQDYNLHNWEIVFNTIGYIQYKCYKKFNIDF